MFNLCFLPALLANVLVHLRSTLTDTESVSPRQSENSYCCMKPAWLHYFRRMTTGRWTEFTNGRERQIGFGRVCFDPHQFDHINELSRWNRFFHELFLIHMTRQIIIVHDAYHTHNHSQTNATETQCMLLTTSSLTHMRSCTWRCPHADHAVLLGSQKCVITSYMSLRWTWKNDRLTWNKLYKL